MDDRIRISDADRDRIIGRLNHNFAEGRLTQEELDDRVTRVLHAKTFGDLRGVMADLPEPVSVSPGAPGAPGAAHAPQVPGAAPWMFRRRGPRILPLVALALLLAVLFIPAGGLLLFAVKALVVIWLLACLAGIFVVAQLRRHLRRQLGGGWWSGYMRYWHPDRGWGDPGQSGFTRTAGAGGRYGGCGRRGRRYMV
jgi:hypothetical protein